MRAKLHHLWVHHRPALILFSVASVVAVALVFRLGMMALYWHPPEGHPDKAEPWMTPGFIVRAWKLPSEDLAPILGVTLGEKRGQTLGDIAKAQGIPLEVYLETVSDALEALGHE